MRLADSWAIRMKITKWKWQQQVYSEAIMTGVHYELVVGITDCEESHDEGTGLYNVTFSLKFCYG